MRLAHLLMEVNKMNISILGTNGFLSSAIAKYANLHKWKLNVYGLDEPQDHTFDHFHKVNLMDAEIDCSALIDSDMIVYAIGGGIQANLKENCSLIYNLNVTVPVGICNKLKELDYKGRFVTFGSVFEMGETKEERFFTEEDILSSVCQAPNDYTISKRMLSRFVANYKHDFKHWHFYIPTIYGEGENPKRLIPYTIYSIRNRESLHFTAGDQIRQYIHVNELPYILDLAYSNDISSGIYNIEGNETMSVKEIVTTIHNSMGEKVPSDCFGSVQRADIGMKYLALDGTKLRNATGFIATTNIIDVIERY